VCIYSHGGHCVGRLHRGRKPYKTDLVSVARWLLLSFIQSSAYSRPGSCAFAPSPRRLFRTNPSLRAPQGSCNGCRGTARDTKRSGTTTNSADALISRCPRRPARIGRCESATFAKANGPRRDLRQPTVRTCHFYSMYVRARARARVCVCVLYETEINTSSQERFFMIGSRV